MVCVDGYQRLMVMIESTRLDPPFLLSAGSKPLWFSGRTEPLVAQVPEQAMHVAYTLREELHRSTHRIVYRAVRDSDHTSIIVKFSRQGFSPRRMLRPSDTSLTFCQLCRSTACPAGMDSCPTRTAAVSSSDFLEGQAPFLYKTSGNQCVAGSLTSHQAGRR